MEGKLRKWNECTLLIYVHIYIYIYIYLYITIQVHSNSRSKEPAEDWSVLVFFHQVPLASDTWN